MKPMKFKQADVGDVDSFIADPHYTMQQKCDGNRTVLRILGGRVTVLGGAGEPVKSTTSGPVAEQVRTWAEGVFTHMPDMLIDGEVVGKTWWVFDLLVDAAPEWDFETRCEQLTQVMERVDLPGFIRVLPTAKTTAEKQILWKRIVESGAEGVIAKRRDSKWRWDARVADALKIKVTHTVDCFILERDIGGKDNARLGIHRKDGSTYEVGKCSMIGKPAAQVGDVCEIKYLYAGQGGRLVQLTLLRIRDDKTAEECTTEQLHFVTKKIIQMEDA